MKSLESYGVSEISHNETVTTEGGILPLLVFVGVALVASACYTTAPSTIGGALPMKSDTTRKDSTDHHR
jgi:hypothetical protein